MSWAAVAGAVVGGGISAISGGRAAKKQQQAANEANRLQWEMFQQNRADQAPWREAGARGIGRLEYLLGVGGGDGNTDPAYGSLMRDFGLSDFQADPGYQFRLQQGEQSINRNALAKGRYNSGSVLKALQGYNSDLASQEFGNAFNRYQANRASKFGQLAALSGVGQAATNQVNADRSALGNALAGNAMAVGNAGAARSIGVGNAINDALTTGFNIWQGNQMMNTIRSRQGGGGTYGAWRNPFSGYDGGGDGS